MSCIAIPTVVVVWPRLRWADKDGRSSWTRCFVGWHERWQPRYCEKALESNYPLLRMGRWTQRTLLLLKDLWTLGSELWYSGALNPFDVARIVWKPTQGYRGGEERGPLNSDDWTTCGYSIAESFYTVSSIWGLQYRQKSMRQSDVPRSSFFFLCRPVLFGSCTLFLFRLS